MLLRQKKHNHQITKLQNDKKNLIFVSASILLAADINLKPDTPWKLLTPYLRIK